MQCLQNCWVLFYGVVFFCPPMKYFLSFLGEENNMSPVVGCKCLFIYLLENFLLIGGGGFCCFLVLVI